MERNDIVIRDYRPEDWNRLQAIHDRARMVELQYAGLTEAFLPLAHEAEREGLSDCVIRVACLNDRVRGFTAFREDELRWLYVDTLYAGQGIGKSLIRHVIGHTEKRPLKIEVLAGNTPALNLYKAMGFRPVRNCSGILPGDGNFGVTVHCLELS